MSVGTETSTDAVHCPEFYNGDLDKQHNRLNDFQYPIIEPSTEIRLLRFLPNSTRQQIKCSLQTTSVDHCPHEYTALSYQWGNASVLSDVKSIEVDGQTFWVRNNLYQFLQRLHSWPSQAHDAFWIDSICINQFSLDVSERSAQVTLMAKLYFKAQRVIIWLGEPSDDDDRRLAELQDYMSRAAPEAWSAETQATFTWLCSNSYWTRVWIVQEIFLAQCLVVRYGSFIVDWVHFANLLPYTARQHYPGLNPFNKPLRYRRGASSKPKTSLTWSHAENIVAEKKRWLARGIAEDSLWGTSCLGDKQTYLLRDMASPSYVTGIPLHETLRRFKGQQCEDPRDKIYGFLGLLSDDQGRHIRPDYSKSREHIYRETLQVIFHDIDTVIRSSTDTINPNRRYEHADFEEDLAEALQIPESERDKQWSPGDWMDFPPCES